MIRSQLTATSASQIQAILVPHQQVAGITCVGQHAWPIFVFCVQMGFYRVGQAGLKHLTSGDRSSLAFQSAGITGMSYRTRPDSLGPCKA